MTATLRDIAKLAGVNAGSVSRVLQNHPRARAFRPETRQRILEAAQKLHYRRNELAAAIRTGRNRTVAVNGVSPSSIASHGLTAISIPSRSNTSRS